MTRDQANKILDRRRRGQDIPQYAILTALFVTGDLPPPSRRTRFRRYPRYDAQGRRA